METNAQQDSAFDHTPAHDPIEPPCVNTIELTSAVPEETNDVDDQMMCESMIKFTLALPEKTNVMDDQTMCDPIELTSLPEETSGMDIDLMMCDPIKLNSSVPEKTNFMDDQMVCEPIKLTSLPEKANVTDDQMVCELVPGKTNVMVDQMMCKPIKLTSVPGKINVMDDKMVSKPVKLTLVKKTNVMDDQMVHKPIKHVPQKTYVLDDQMMLKNVVFEKLLQEKKLPLVLDLDHTLIHSAKIKRLTPQDRDLIIKETDDPNSSRNLVRVKVTEEDEYVIKLRPGLRHFLKEASKLFQMHVFTKGSRDYAMMILRVIDPENVYFGCNSSSSSPSFRVFTRESCVVSCGMKSLDMVMGIKSGILIIDDKEDAWRDVDKENVLKIPPYNFFEQRRDQILFPRPLEGKNESETDAWLDLFLHYFLMTTHAMFFDPQGEGHVTNRDVRVFKNKLLDHFSHCEKAEN